MKKLLSRPARLLRRHRRAASALLAALAVWCLALALQPAPPPTVPAVVAARDLPGGTLLSTADLAVVDVPAALAPASVLGSPAALVGRILSAPVDKGIPVTMRSVVSEALVAGTPGRVLAPIRLADPDLGALLAPGMSVDVLGADDGRASVVAAGAHVVALPRPSAQSGPFAAGADNRGLLVIVEVTPGEASELAQAAVRGRLTIALR